MKMKRVLVAIMCLTLLVTGIIGNGSITYAADNPSVVLSEDNVDLVVKPGDVTHVTLPIKAVGDYIGTQSIEVNVDKAPFTVTKPSLSRSNSPVTDIIPNTTTYLEFDVKVNETASIGKYPIKVTFSYNDYSDNGLVIETATLNTYLQILEEKEPAQLTVSSVYLSNDTIGNTANLEFNVKNEGEIIARNTYLSINYQDSGIIEKYTAKKIKVGDLKPDDYKRITLPVAIPTSASEGKKNITIDFTYKTADGDEIKESYPITVELKADDNSPNIYIDSMDDLGELKPGEDFTLSLVLANNGATSAYYASVDVDASSISKDGILKNYFTDGIYISTIKKDGTKKIAIPLTISKYAAGGLRELKLNVTYTDDPGVEHTVSCLVYIDVAGEVSTVVPNVIISGVVQNPANPVAGGRLDLSFDIENKSQVDISDLKIELENLVGNTFIPLESEPYQYIEKLKAGEKKRITLPLSLSNNIPEGLNNLTVKYTYSGNQGETIDIPVRNVQNDLGNNSKPKLIVSRYYADVEEIRAGGTFNFTFELKNTHSSVAAKNITVSITQADNIFTVTQGSNSFFINKIGPGETVENTLEMKAKSDASTKTYPLDITIEYEYDGIKSNPETGDIGETKTEKLNLQVVENSRPVINNINVYSFDGQVTLGNPATLAFEFYNMGKSPLNNVTVTVEGDFMQTNGNMYFIGNVAEGSSTYAEFEVIPNMEGTSKGILHVSFEDSNGDPVEITKEFEAPVMAAGNFDPGMGGGDPGEVFNPIEPQVKKEILPVWLFIVIQVVVFILFIPITRKIIISVYKSKLRKKEMEQY
jgi:hypothetical protein